MSVAVIATIFASSCSDSDSNSFDDEGSKVVLPTSQRVFILNEGTDGLNNANITFYDPLSTESTSTISDIFRKQNNAGLGDLGFAATTLGNHMYVSVSGSNYLSALNSACVETGRLLFAADPELAGGVRYVAAKGGYVYASFYGGIVAKINASTMKVEAKLKTPGANLEGVAIVGNSLYVCNSYEITGGQYIFKDEVYVVDLNTFTVTQTVKVNENPNLLLACGGKVFLICYDYSTPSYVLQCIDPTKNNAVSNIGYATHFAAKGSTLYLCDSRTNYSTWPFTATNTFATYDVATGTMSTAINNKLAAAVGTSSVSCIGVSPESGDVYVGTTIYSTGNGDMYRYSASSTSTTKFDCGGQNPRALIFF